MTSTVSGFCTGPGLGQTGLALGVHTRLVTDQHPSMPEFPGEPGGWVLNPPTMPRQPRWKWIVVAAVAAVLFIGGGVAVGLALAGRGGGSVAVEASPSSSWTPMQWGSSFTVNGSLVLADSGGVQKLAGSVCQGTGGYDDIRQGTQVVVTDESGTVIATGELESGLLVGGHCMFAFTVSSVPSGKSFYGVSVSHRGTLQYKQDQLQSGVQLSLGSS